MTNNIESIRERMSAWDSGHPSGKRMLERNAPTDIAFLLAEVERLTADKARLDHCDTMIDLEPDAYVLRFKVDRSMSIREAIDAAMRPK